MWSMACRQARATISTNANRINGKAFDMNEPMFAAARGQYERWVISGKGDMMLHPFPISTAPSLRILSENGKPPAAHRRGWKDTVRVEGDVSEVLMKFDHPAPKEFCLYGPTATCWNMKTPG